MTRLWWAGGVAAILWGCPRAGPPERPQNVSDHCRQVIRSRNLARVPDALDRDRGCPFSGFNPLPNPGCPDPAEFDDAPSCAQTLVSRPVLRRRPLRPFERDWGDEYLAAVLLEAPPEPSNGASSRDLEELRGVMEVCRRILQSEPLRSTLERIALVTEDEVVATLPAHRPLDKVQRGFATAMMVIDRWQYCDREFALGNQRFVHGLFDAQHWRVTLYPTSCDAREIYDDEIITLNRVYRFNLVMAHELGHVIDALDGKLNHPDECGDRERRATLYGAYLARCYGGVMRFSATSLTLDEYGMDLEDDEELKACISEQYRAFDARLDGIIQRAAQSGADATAGARTLPPELLRTAACVGR